MGEPGRVMRELLAVLEAHGDMTIEQLAARHYDTEQPSKEQIRRVRDAVTRLRLRDDVMVLYDQVMTMQSANADPAVAFTNRFRQVSTRYPHMVTLAYGGDSLRALADDPATVAANVADYERSQGGEPRDWSAIGRGDIDESEGHSGVDEGF